MDSKRLDKLITDSLAIEAEAAKEAGAIGYMATVDILLLTGQERSIFKNHHTSITITTNTSHRIHVLTTRMTGLDVTGLTKQNVKTTADVLAYLSDQGIYNPS